MRLRSYALPVLVLLGCSSSAGSNHGGGTGVTVNHTAPTAALAGSIGISVTVYGSGFAAGTTVTWNGVDLATTYIDEGMVVVVLPAQALAGAGALDLVLTTPEVGSTHFSFVVTPADGLYIDHLSPSMVSAGSPELTVTMVGSGFVSGSSVSSAGASLATSYVDAQTLTVQVPAESLAEVGTMGLLVTNPGGATAQAWLIIGPAQGPVVDHLDPSTVTAGSPDFTLTIVGSGFASNAVVILGSTPLAATFVDTGTLTVVVPAAAVALVGSSQLVVIIPGSGTAYALLTIAPVPPTVDHVTPDTVEVGSSSNAALAITGTGFAPGVMVWWSGTPLSTSYVSGTTVQANLPTSAMAAAGTVSLVVRNPDGGSVQTQITVGPHPAPVVTGVTPSTAVVGDTGFWATIQGSSFRPSSTVSWGSTSLDTTVVDQGQIQARIPAEALAAVGTVELIVTTPAPGGGTSNAQLVVGWPAPQVDHVDPGLVVYGHEALVATVLGSGFAPVTTVSWNDAPLTTTFQDASTLLVAIPAQALASPGPLALAVTTPTPGGGAAQGSLTVEPAPVLQAVAPPEGHVATQVTLVGQNFGSPGTGGTVTVGGTPVTIVSWSDTQIEVTMPATAATAVAPVQVVSGGASSNSVDFIFTAAVAGQLVDAAPTSSLMGTWAMDGSGNPARLVVTAADTGHSTTATPTGYGGFPQAFSFDVPLGTRAIAVQELDGQGSATVDLLQSATRQVTGVVVGPDGVTGLQIPLKWHWETQALDPGFNVCGYQAQIAFRDSDHGFVTFQVNPGVDAALDPLLDPYIHGAIMATSDGGRTWALLQRDISSTYDDFRPHRGNWFSGGYLLPLSDGETILSLDWLHARLVRSTNGGQTWQPVVFPWQAIGPGNASPTRFAQSGSTLYASVGSGGVQGSYPREDLLVSADKGASWQVMYDVCDSNGYGVVCPNQVPFGFAGQDMACSDVDDQHCISMGNRDWAQSTVLVTTDGFSTHASISPSCGVFTGLVQVAWVPGTLTAHVVGGSSCTGTPIQHMVTQDGGATWSTWQPSPFPGRVAYASATDAVSWWDWGVRVSHDAEDAASATWLFTGHAPSAAGALGSVAVLDKDHLWALGNPDCRESGAAYVARWVP